MGKKYASPSAFRTALTQAAKKISRQTGMSMPELMKVFYFSRLAARVFTAEPDGWLIKGGQALLIRYEGAARLSRDIDLQCASPDRTAEEAAARVIEAATRNLDDFLRFVPGKFTGHSEEGRGGSQYFTVYLGNTKVDSVKVDLVVGRDLVGTPETRSLKSAVGLEWPVDWPQVLLYPVVDHVADKICAMYERHGDHGSNRYRDLADLLLISRQEHIPGEATHQALHREADRRRRLGTRITLPDAFQAPRPRLARRLPRPSRPGPRVEGLRHLPRSRPGSSTLPQPPARRICPRNLEPEPVSLAVSFPTSVWAGRMRTGAGTGDSQVPWLKNFGSRHAVPPPATMKER